MKTFKKTESKWYVEYKPIGGDRGKEYFDSEDDAKSYYRDLVDRFHEPDGEGDIEWVEEPVEESCKQNEATFKQGVDSFLSYAPEGGWSDYWAMQQDWEAFKDGLCRDGQITQKQAYSWGNPCTPDTFDRWQKRNGLIRRGGWDESKQGKINEGPGAGYTIKITSFEPNRGRLLAGRGFNTLVVEGSMDWEATGYDWKASDSDYPVTLSIGLSRTLDEFEDIDGAYDARMQTGSLTDFVNDNMDYIIGRLKFDDDGYSYGGGYTFSCPSDGEFVFGANLVNDGYDNFVVEYDYKARDGFTIDSPDMADEIRWVHDTQSGFDKVESKQSEGWVFGWSSKEAMLDELVSDMEQKWNLEKSYGTWYCYVNKETGRPLVVYYKIDKDGRDWGVKEISSDMGLAESNIQAAKWLKPRLEKWEQEHGKVDGYDWDWIERSLGKQAANKSLKDMVKNLKPGDKVKLIPNVADGAVVEYVRTISPSKIVIHYNGREMACKTSYIASKVDSNESKQSEADYTRASKPIADAYKVLDNYYLDNGKLSDFLTEQVLMTYKNDGAMYRRSKSKAVKSHSLAWESLLATINALLEWDDETEHATKLTSEQVKNWFKANGVDYKEALKPLVDAIENQRKEWFGVEESLDDNSNDILEKFKSYLKDLSLPKMFGEDYIYRDDVDDIYSNELVEDGNILSKRYWTTLHMLESARYLRPAARPAYEEELKECLDAFKDTYGQDAYNKVLAEDDTTILEQWYEFKDNYFEKRIANNYGASNAGIYSVDFEADIDIDEGAVFFKMNLPCEPSVIDSEYPLTEEGLEKLKFDIERVFTTKYEYNASKKPVGVVIPKVSGDAIHSKSVQTGYYTDNSGLCHIYVDGVEKDVMDFDKAVDAGYNLQESKKSEKLTQKDLKQMATSGAAIDITNVSDEEAKEIRSRKLDTVAISRGTYGMNGALLKDKEGKTYVITARNSNLFYFV